MPHTRTILLLLALLPTFEANCADALIKHLESVPDSELFAYGLRDNEGRSLDCLKVFQSETDHKVGKYHGVYHTRRDGVFAVNLASSENLVNWRHITTLDTHGSQATIWPCANNAYILAHEKDGRKSCWIRLRYYESVERLRAGKYTNEFDIPRSLAPTAEGTPSFETVNIDDSGVSSSQIDLRFHYFKNADVDQLAQGTLRNFTSWKATPLQKINTRLVNQGWRGNLGDRDKFTWLESNYYLQEIQRQKGDWSSWRICLCDDTGMPLRPLNIQTHNRSQAFANPTTTWVTDRANRRMLVVTLFLPIEGNSRSEAGSLLYVIDPSQNDAATSGN